MKVFISADIEGITGVTDWNETELDNGESGAACEQMTAEVAAACEGALAAGASEVWVKDSHDTARNISAGGLPQQTRLIRGWSGHPYVTLQELDKTFGAVMLIGYHSGACFGSSPLEHSYSGTIWTITLNGLNVSEFLVDAYTCAYVGVPLVLLSGDKGICEEAKRVIPAVHTVAVKEGRGGSTINQHPQWSTEHIKEEAAKALQDAAALKPADLPGHFSLQVRYRRQAMAYKQSYFPGVKLLDPLTVGLETDDYFDVLRYLLFGV